jgi:hypothetical protein
VAQFLEYWTFAPDCICWLGVALVLGRQSHIGSKVPYLLFENESRFSPWPGNKVYLL